MSGWDQKGDLEDFHYNLEQQFQKANRKLRKERRRRLLVSLWQEFRLELMVISIGAVVIAIELWVLL